MAHRIALNFEDGVTHFVESLPGETVAESAYRVGVNIPLDCADGACGTCKCRAVAGQFDPGSYIEDALTDEEAAAGFALACQMRPATDLVVGILASSAACKVKAATIAATVVELEQLSPEIHRLTLRPTSGPGFSFLPGQYVHVAVPGTGLSRSYSFSSAPTAGEYSLLIRHVPDGVMTNYLQNQAAVGDELHLTGPIGSFYARELTRPALFFAGGTGIAPFLAMLAAWQLDGKGTQPVRLFYGATKEYNLVELDALTALAATLPDFQFFTSVSNESSTQHREGFITQWIVKDELSAADYDVYCCGPPPMVEAIRTALHEQGIMAANFYQEKFVPSGNDVLQPILR